MSTTNISEDKTWSEAQSYCREKYTDLATVYDMTDMKRLLGSAENQGEAWIGLYNQTDSNRKWHWSLPGVEYKEDRKNWNGHEPNDVKSPENCVQMSPKWVDVPCAHTYVFICYDEELILIKESKTWEEALNYCRENHSDLVSITNPHQQRWVQRRAKKASTPFVWLGLRYTCTLGLWFWVNDQLVCYDKWGPRAKH
ncbi:L-selectin-like protein [Lates japonicus]|uniref:L-selectin-like protein n=1 Tax=Lates japonicus TaxID=270547 RepID=A0AAD3MPY7_LATJO|nr:L-selectin-like protein [Lates japonicus]